MNVVKILNTLRKVRIISYYTEHEKSDVILDKKNLIELDSDAQLSSDEIPEKPVRGNPNTTNNNIWSKIKYAKMFGSNSKDQNGLS